MQAGVGIRELRQNLSKYLRRVAAGETLRVLDRGKPVAVLAPLPEMASTVERLTAQGVLKRAGGNLLSLGPPPDRPADISVSEALEEQRSDDPDGR